MIISSIITSSIIFVKYKLKIILQNFVFNLKMPTVVARNLPLKYGIC